MKKKEPIEKRRRGRPKKLKEKEQAKEEGYKKPKRQTNETVKDVKRRKL